MHVLSPNYEQGAETRDEAIARACASGGYTLQEVGAYFGLHYSRISRIVKSREGADDAAKGRT